MKKAINAVHDFIITKILMIACPIIAGPYYLCLDVFGDKWKWISLHPVFHQCLFFIFIAIGTLTSLLHAIYEYANRNSKDYSQDVLDCFNNVVKLKKTRFLSKLSDIAPQSNIFKIITHPIDQIQQSSVEYYTLLARIFKIPQDHIDITIIDDTTAPPKFIFQKNQNTKHTHPQQLLSEKSTASLCIDRGLPIYIADKNKSEKSKEYFISNSDRIMGNGSIYCYPVLINKSSIQHKYIITISTYGKRFCDSPSVITEDSTKNILQNIAERIELELDLQAIKDYTEEQKKKKLQGKDKI